MPGASSPGIVRQPAAPSLGAPGHRQGWHPCCTFSASAGATQGGCWHCAWGWTVGGGRPLTACPSWLLQMGGGARQAREPADHGGHATGGKRPRPGEAGGRAPRWRAEAGGQVPAQPLLRGAGGLSHLPRFGAGRAPPAHGCRKPGLRSPVAVSATQACARGLGPRRGWWASCQVGSQPQRALRGRVRVASGFSGSLALCSGPCFTWADGAAD